MYDYKSAMRSDILENLDLYDKVFEDNACNGEFCFEEIYQGLYDAFLMDDSVTGNCSGSHTYSSYQAEMNLAGNWDLMSEAFSEFGMTVDPDNPEAADVTVRCYLLPEILGDVLKELKDDYDDDKESLPEWMQKILKDSMEEDE